MTIVKNFLANATLVVASLLLWSALLFAAGEIYLQTRYGSLPPGPPVEWNVYDARRGWTLKPGHYSYFNVEAVRYATGNLREVYFYRDQLKGHTERTYHPGQ